MQRKLADATATDRVPFVDRRFGERVVFLHTGGIFGLFPAAPELAPLL